jgi:CRISPR-associated protein Cas5h
MLEFRVVGSYMPLTPIHKSETIMQITVFEFSAKFGHFLRAEANASAPSYPLPPRTALLGLLGAILGLEKDSAQVELAEAQIALAGRIPATHWHTAKLRKDPPAALPWTVKSRQRCSKTPAPEKATLIAQEWLFQPCFVVYAALSSTYANDFDERLRLRRWHFSPCMGLSEMLADLHWQGSFQARSLPEAVYRINTVVPEATAQLDNPSFFKDQLAVRHLRLPREVTPDRVFRHAAYFVEREGKAIPARTNAAWEVEDKMIMFL